jgi:Arc/MetJ-type ribon-helix-helix transcriptional regulator
MNVTLPPQLSRFVEKKVKEGTYSNESEVVCDALRRLRERDRLLRGNATGLWSARSSTGLVSSLSSRYDQVISNMGVGEGDIEAVAFIVLMQATNDMDKDLKAIMDEVKSMTAAKQKLREVIARVNADIATNAGQSDGKPPLDFQTGMGNQKAYHEAQMPFADPESEGGVKIISIDLFPGEIVDVSQLVAIREDLKGKLDSMNEMSEITSLRLQMIMDRRSKMISMLSNIMKMSSDTQDTLVQNLK